jgi:hypothetical protein
MGIYSISNRRRNFLANASALYIGIQLKNFVLLDRDVQRNSVYSWREL